MEAAREALDGGERLDLWPSAREAGWPGLLIAEDRGGAGLGALDAMLVMAECGRVLATVPLLGHLPATAILDAATGSDERTGDLLRRLGDGEARVALAPARPPSDLHAEWTVESKRGLQREPAPRFDGAAITGTISWVPDAPGADALLVVAIDGRGDVVAVLVEDGFEVQPVGGFDATRLLGHISCDAAPATHLGVAEDELKSAWYLAQSLIGAESIGAVETALETSVSYAKDRHAFGRAIGSYQAIKHQLVEVLRLLENARSLLYYAGWAHRDRPDEFPLAASAARFAADKAADYATRAFIAVHGGIGATWEHDAHLYFRRAQLSRRLLGGVADAAERLAEELLGQAPAAA